MTRIQFKLTEHFCTPFLPFTSHKQRQVVADQLPEKDLGSFLSTVKIATEVHGATAPCTSRGPVPPKLPLSNSTLLPTHICSSSCDI
ncbi:hypothetical protein Y1Q_0002151 [Alligator mississippiensis]|uniref:Uncharacterized protein n=1 Tax=Alligator mississippiensis TaxID=8496 RepID=A0A151MPX1_ALLMI|nr:hypothetical protein Y1Q_0002151 [Alligator mississippiensis]